MALFGFSTGALALGDFRRALLLLRDVDADAVDLSAHREKGLPDPELRLARETFDRIGAEAPHGARGPATA